MGCHTSRAETQVTEALDTSTITILLAGTAGAGKSALARRFVHKVFDDVVNEPCSGERHITINEAPVIIKLVDGDDLASQARSDNVDAVLYVADGAAAAADELAVSPFHQASRYLDALYSCADAQIKSVGSSCSFPVGLLHSVGSVESMNRSAGSLAGSKASATLPAVAADEVTPSPQPPSADPAAHDVGEGAGADPVPQVRTHPGAGMVVDAGEVETKATAEPAVFFNSLRLPSPSPRAGSAIPRGMTPIDLPGSPTPATPGGTRRARPAGLRRPPSLNTKQHRVHRAPGHVVVPSSDTIPPFAAVVSKWDTMEHRSGERAVVRLQAMARNWSDANRCSVTFVSAKTGFGMKHAFTHLIRQVVARRLGAEHP